MATKDDNEQKAATTRAAKDEQAPENTGAVSAEQQAVRTGVSNEDLNPAFAPPEKQEEIKKAWAGKAEHTVDAEKVLKEQGDK